MNGPGNGNYDYQGGYRGYYTNPLVVSLITTCTTSFGKEEGVSELTCLFCGG